MNFEIETSLRHNVKWIPILAPSIKIPKHGPVSTVDESMKNVVSNNYFSIQLFEYFGCLQMYQVLGAVNAYRL